MTVYKWNELSSAEITNLYLYGQATKPANLVDESLVRPKDAATMIHMDALSFMQSGPGRFAHASSMALVQEFFEGKRGTPTGSYAEYTAEQLVKPGESTYQTVNLRIQQPVWSDGRGDEGERTWTYNSSWFQFAPETRFVIDSAGNRYIKDFAMLPINDNYDFQSDNKATIILNGLLEPVVDPSGIGRRIDINFDSASLSAIPRVSRFGPVEYGNDVLRKNAQYSPVSGPANTLLQGNEIQSRLWDAGVLKHVIDDRAAIYGTQRDDTIVGTRTLNHVDLSWEVSALVPYARNGVVYVTGAGNDTVRGTAGNDKFYGGSGNDIVIGGKGDDYLAGGTEFDTYEFMGKFGWDLVLFDGQPSRND